MAHNNSCCAHSRGGAFPDFLLSDLRFVSQSSRVCFSQIRFALPRLWGDKGVSCAVLGQGAKEYTPQPCGISRRCVVCAVLCRADFPPFRQRNKTLSEKQMVLFYSYFAFAYLLYFAKYPNVFIFDNSIKITVLPIGNTVIFMNL